jgi:tetratricopeptide (TPR) repeat protein
MSARAPHQFVAEIEAMLERQRLASAKMRLNEALQHFPDHPELLLQSARLEYLEDRNGAALTTLQQVLRLTPDNEQARFLLFALKRDEGALADAEQVIVSLLHDYPEHAPFYGSYGDLMIRAMNLPKARALADEGLKYDAEDAMCLVVRTLCDLIERPTGASSHALQQLLVRSPQSTYTLILLRAALADRGDYRGALRIAQELVRAEPANGDFVQAVQELKVVTHWSMLPLWPMQRWGWGAAIGLWLAINVILRVLASQGAEWADLTIALSFGFLAYVIYSWVWPPLLRRWMVRA